MGAQAGTQVHAVKPPPSAVLDTNVVLSALVFREGRVATLRAAWQSERFQPLVAKSTVEELLRALAYPKFRLSVEDRQDLLADFLPWCRVVAMPSRLPRLPPCRDPNDLPFLQLAAAGKASYLVSGDRDLLVLDGQVPFRVLGPAAFMAALASLG